MGNRKTPPWCCLGFETNFQHNFEQREWDGVFTDRRGFFVACRREGKDPFFTLVHRAVAKENVGKLAQSVPITLEEEMGIAFCPWCGVRLAKHYARHLDVLMNDP